MLGGSRIDEISGSEIQYSKIRDSKMDTADTLVTEVQDCFSRRTWPPVDPKPPAPRTVSSSSYGKTMHQTMKGTSREDGMHTWTSWTSGV